MSGSISPVRCIEITKNVYVREFAVDRKFSKPPTYSDPLNFPICSATFPSNSIMENPFERNSLLCVTLGIVECSCGDLGIFALEARKWQAVFDARFYVKSMSILEDRVI